jgi:thioredoxin reductase
MDTTWDCIVVGGGAAGLSAALVLGRARRRTLVVDLAGQSNLAAHGIGGLLGQEGRPPAELYADGHAELAALPSVEVRRGEVVDGAREGARFVLDLADGAREASRRVLLATGMEYRPPALPGVAERWGGSVFHCPFCHGWEVRGRPLGVLDRGATGVERALLLRMWSGDVTLLADGPADLDEEQAARLRAASVVVDERRVTGLRGPGDALSAVVFEGGAERPLEGLMVEARLHQRSDLAARLGAKAAEPNPMAADAVAVDAGFATNVPGLLAAGDLTGVMPSVANAVSAGSNAAAWIVRSLLGEVAEVSPAALAD